MLFSFMDFGFTIIYDYLFNIAPGFDSLSPLGTSPKFEILQRIMSNSFSNLRKSCLKIWQNIVCT